MAMEKSQPRGRIGILILVLSAFVAWTSSEECSPEKYYKPFTDDSSGKTYYICYGTTGEAVPQTCPDGLFFNASVSGCSWTGDIGTPATEYICITDETIFPHESDCLKYYSCVGKTPDDEAEETACDPEEVFNSALGECVSSAEWFCESEGPDCDISEFHDKTYNVLGDCQSYFQCYNDALVKGKCASGYYFDFKSQICAVDDGKKCGKSSSSSSSGSAIVGICQGNAKKFVIDPSYCRGYYYCVDENTPYWSYCATENKYFDSGKCVKNPPARCTCETVEYETDTEKIQMPHADKDKYVVCEKGKPPSIKICPPNYIYSKEEKSCVSA